ncbi:AAA family ATPase [Crassaminicella thermophila]|uniref:AAA family ATPase n=1 Tax=Crassaminicella thermophila TaxID=2599308 RepID=UPI001E5EE718|nr:AAA family ATPase [Crassaminicella thermophila]
MLIQIKSLKLRNFKGIRDLTISFGKVTDIYGENATGKTTIADAFTWLLFDKDSKDRTAFDIKTLDRNGQVIHGLEHEVTGVLSVDGTDITLSKIYKEKWTRKRGQAESQFTGHETLYSIDDVPVKKSEYQKKINEIINENIFKLITSPLYFSTKMKWQDRRNVLLEIIGDITSERIINYKADLRPLEQLLGDKDIDTLKKSITAKKKRLNDEIKSIPYRIDELNNSIQELDFEALEFRKRGVAAGIKNIDEMLLDRSKVNEEFLKEKDKLYKLKSKLKDIEYKVKSEAEEPLKQLNSELREAEKEKTKLDMELYKINNAIETKENLVNSIEKELAELREKWNLVNQEELHIPEDSFICPTCKRPLEEHDIEAKKAEMIENFNQNKAEKLAAINNLGKFKKSKLDEHKTEKEKLKVEKDLAVARLEEVNEILIERKAKIDNFTPSIDLENNQEYQEVLKQIKELEQKFSTPVEMNHEIHELKMKKASLEKELEEINGQLAYKRTEREK